MHLRLCCGPDGVASIWETTSTRLIAVRWPDGRIWAGFGVDEAHAHMLFAAMEMEREDEVR